MQVWQKGKAKYIHIFVVVVVVVVVFLFVLFFRDQTRGNKHFLHTVNGAIIK